MSIISFFNMLSAILVCKWIRRIFTSFLRKVTLAHKVLHQERGMGPSGVVPIAVLKYESTLDILLTCI